VPGPTWVNRFFVHCATSDGQIDNKHTINRRTIYDNLSAHNVSWFMYYGDVSQAWTIRSVAASGNNGPSGTVFNSMEYFADVAMGGDLPAYTFLEPRFVALPCDQHPDHDVNRGENLIADVYEAIRNSPSWNDTLLIIVYDEHGGIFDHVTPPAAVNPDGKIFQSPQLTFGFDRLGLRVPAILVSPYAERGGIDSTVYDHTSILATVKNRFGLPNFLTARDAAAATFEGSLSLSNPRTDAPTTLPRGVRALAARNEPIWPAQLNDFQQDMMDFSAQISQDPAAHPSVRAAAARLYNRKDPV
jgi:phospholipase C